MYTNAANSGHKPVNATLEYWVVISEQRNWARHLWNNLID